MDGLAALVSSALLGSAGLITALSGVRRGDRQTRTEVRTLRRQLIAAEGAIYRLKMILVRHGLMSEYEAEHADEEPDDPDDMEGQA